MANITMSISMMLLTNPFLAAKVWMNDNDEVKDDIELWIVAAACKRIAAESNENETIRLTIVDTGSKSKTYYFTREKDVTEGGQVSNIVRGSAQVVKTYMRITSTNGLNITYLLSRQEGERTGGILGGPKEVVSAFKKSIESFKNDAQKAFDNANPFKQMEKFNEDQ